MSAGPRLCRSFQTAPAAVPRDDTAKYLASGLTAEGFEVPDWLVPDVEDGTAPDMKETAVSNVLDLLAEHGPDFPGEVWPRVEWSHDDPALRDRGADQVETLLAGAGEHVEGVVVPKVGRPDDVERALARVADAEAAAGLPEGSVEVAVIVETAAARSALRSVAALGGRLAALVFGPVDYAADLGARAVGGARPEWPGVLSALSNEASANGLVAVGGPFDRLFGERAGVRYYRAEAYAEQAEREARVGLDGSWSLHPKQTVQANHVHAPSPAAVAGAIRGLEAFEEAKAGGTGAVTVDGQMVDEATARNFRNVVATVGAVHERAPAQAGSLWEEDAVERALALAG